MSRMFQVSSALFTATSILLFLIATAGFPANVRADPPTDPAPECVDCRLCGNERCKLCLGCESGGGSANQRWSGHQCRDLVGSCYCILIGVKRLPSKSNLHRLPDHDTFNSAMPVPRRAALASFPALIILTPEDRKPCEFGFPRT